MSKPMLILIGADKGGVGKTTVARAVLDYFNASGFNHRAFDSESPAGVLKRFFPRSTDVIDLTDVTDQMKIFDTLSSECVTVVDLRAGALSPVLKTLGDVGLFDLVKSGAVHLVVLHVIGASIASFAEVRETAAMVSDAAHILVRNHLNESTFFEWDAASADVLASSGALGVIDVPRLAERANEDVDHVGVPFRSYAAGDKIDGTPANYSFVLKGLVKTWLKAVFAEFDRVGLNALVNTARA